MFIVGTRQDDERGTSLTVVFLPTFSNIALIVMLILAFVVPGLRDAASGFASTISLAYLFFVTYQLSTRRFRRCILNVLHEKLEADNSIMRRWRDEDGIPT